MVSDFAGGFLFISSLGCVAMWIGLLGPLRLGIMLHQTTPNLTRLAHLVGTGVATAPAFLGGMFALGRYVYWRYQEAQVQKGDIPLWSELSPSWATEPFWPVIFGGAVFSVIVLSIATRQRIAG